MASLLHRLGAFSHRRYRSVIGAWLLLLVVLVGSVAALGNSLVDDFTIPGSESQSAIDTLGTEFPGSQGSSVQAVVEAPPGSTLADPTYAAQLQGALTAVSQVDGVAGVVTPQQSGNISADGRTALVQIPLDASKGDVSADTLDQISAALDPAREGGLDILLGGNAYNSQAETSHAAELVGVLLALVIMAVTLGSVTAAGLPLLTSLIGVGTGLTGIWLFSHLVTISSTAPTLALMIGLAVGIDYALLIVVRHRAELAAGSTVAASIAKSTATAGSSVIFAGATVVIALLGLAVAQVPFLTAMGIAAAGAVLVAVLIALTLLPAVLAMAGERLRPTPDSKAAARTSVGAARPAAERWVRAVLRRPALVLLGGIAALAVIAIPAASLQLALPDNGSQPSDTAVRQTYDAVSTAFGPGANGPLLVLADLAQSDDPTTAAAAVATELGALDAVAKVAAPRLSDDQHYALIQVVPQTGPADAATSDLVTQIRDDASSIASTTGADVSVTGSTALGVDVSARLLSSIVPFALVVVGLSLVLLMLVFRSLLVPATAALGYLLSLGVSLGVTVAVFQWGWLGDALTGGVTGPLVSFMPIIFMAVLFGLAMDYQVFLVSRIHEAVAAGRSPRDAILEGARHSGRVVVAAALIMIGVFGSFVISGDSTIRPIAFALSVGVLIDAFVVRLTLVPAALGLLGSRAWWLPASLDRVLPHLDVEGASLAEQAAPEQAAPEQAGAQR
ncbi:MMPL family transporter [soil metagenome]